MAAERPEEQHIGLTTASGIAYDQLAERKRGFYDVEHFNEILNNAAQALISITPVYLIDLATGERCRLSDAELLEARVSHGATVLILADGRKVKDLSLLRSDLAAAIKILKDAGLKAFSSTRL
jgi:selenocysteine-specific translation elongation factor